MPWHNKGILLEPFMNQLEILEILSPHDILGHSLCLVRVNLTSIMLRTHVLARVFMKACDYEFEYNYTPLTRCRGQMQVYKEKNNIRGVRVEEHS